MTIVSKFDSERKVSAKKRAKEEVVDRLYDTAGNFRDNQKWDDDGMTDDEYEKVAVEIEKQVERVYRFLGFQY